MEGHPFKTEHFIDGLSRRPRVGVRDIFGQRVLVLTADEAIELARQLYGSAEAAVAQARPERIGDDVFPPRLLEALDLEEIDEF